MNQVPAKSIITRTPNGWLGCDYNMNIYKGCCHGCIYCDSRSDCYRIENFDEVRAKENAIAIIDGELRTKRKKGVVGTGAMSDPYNPFEVKYKLTRGALGLIDRYGFGISVTTKSPLVTRDIDIYESIARHSPVCIKLTITTFDDNLCSKIEPHVAVASKRIEAIRELSKSGVFAGVMLMPLLPFINDSEENVTNIVKATAEAGGKFIYPAFGVTLRENQREYFYKQIDKLFPGMKQRYIRTFGNSYECRSQDIKKIWEVFASLCERYNILYKANDIVTAFKLSYEHEQITLF
jgi:DNA repair photolyase